MPAGSGYDENRNFLMERNVSLVVVVHSESWTTVDICVCAGATGAVHQGAAGASSEAGRHELQPGLAQGSQPGPLRASQAAGATQL